MTGLDRSSLSEIALRNEKEKIVSNLSALEIISAPMLYLDRRMVSLILTRIKLFEKIVSTQGAVVECGVYKGNSLMTFFHLSNILEPNNFNRKIIGFDTFSGFPHVDITRDTAGEVGHLSDTNLELIQNMIVVQENDKFIPHMKKIELVVGDARESIPSYVKANPHLLIALLYLDFDLYEPTKIALDHLLPLVPKGGVVGFDEINQKKWAGETIALKEKIVINDVKLERFFFDPHVSYYQVC